jgi:sulfur carrier protein ThiS
MKIDVELQAYLEQYSLRDSGKFDMDVADGATVGDVIERLGVPAELTSIIIVNGSATTPAHPLSDGDHLLLVPPIAGG